MTLTQRLSGDQRDIIELVDSVAAASGSEPDDANPQAIQELRQTLAESGLWTIGVAESLGGGGADLQLRLTAIAAMADHWPAVAWACAQLHAALEAIGTDLPPGADLDSLLDGTASICVGDLTLPGSTLSVDADQGQGHLPRIDPAGSSPAVVALDVDDAWFLPAESVHPGPVLARTGLAGAMTSAAELSGPATRLAATKDFAAIRARLQLAGAAIAAGLAMEAATVSVAYSQTRIQFGNALTALPTVRAGLFGQTTQAEAAWLRAVDGVPEPASAAATLADNCQTALAVTAAAVQAHGGYGYLDEYPAQRLACDAVSLRAATAAMNATIKAAEALAG